MNRKAEDVVTNKELYNEARELEEKAIELRGRFSSLKAFELDEITYDVIATAHFCLESILKRAIKTKIPKDPNSE